VKDRAAIPYLQWPTNSQSYYDLSNGAIFSDLERPLITTVLMSHHYLTISISETVQDTDIVSIYLHTSYSTASFRMTLSDLEWLWFWLRS